MNTKKRFADLVDDGVENEQLLTELESLVAKAKELRVEYQPILARHQQAMRDAPDALAESIVLAQVVGEMTNLVARVEAAKAKRR